MLLCDLSNLSVTMKGLLCVRKAILHEARLMQEEACWMGARASNAVFVMIVKLVMADCACETEQQDVGRSRRGHDTAALLQDRWRLLLEAAEFSRWQSERHRRSWCRQSSGMVEQELGRACHLCSPYRYVCGGAEASKCLFNPL